MAKPNGFLEYNRKEPSHRGIDQRVKDYLEIEIPHPEEVLIQQAARCMDCGIPFCHGAGCPLENRIPEFNDYVYQGRWKEACDILHATNNFPEITGRICPAPCETSCTLQVNDDPVLIRHIEFQIVEKGFQNGWIKPRPPAVKSGKRVAVIGSGPAGLAAAQQLARAGHAVTVFEKSPKIGGLLRYGIPDFKLDKAVLDRRLQQLKDEGVQFQTDVHVGQDITARYLRKMFDAVCITIGAGTPRDLAVPGRGYENVHFAMEYLTQQNKINAGEPVDDEPRIDARGKIVLVIGGGDTGSDCVGTARRQHAKEIHQFEILSQPHEERPPDTPWPLWPRVLRTSSSQEEGCKRRWSVLTKKLTGLGVKVNQIHAVQVRWDQQDGQWKMSELPGTEFTMNVDLVLLAMGFLHPDPEGIARQFDLKLDPRGNIQVRDFATSQPAVFAAGDASMGASLVVHAINTGRQAAAAIDLFLKNPSHPWKGAQ